MPSNPVNVKELEPPVPPFKKKNPIQQPNTPTAPVATKNGVSNVYITDINGQPIQGTYKSKKLKVWIESKGLQGKEIKLAIYDEDVTTNDLIYHNNFKISKDLYGIEVHLDKLPISKAGRLEGDIELFVDIEVLQNQTHTKSGVVNVDAKAFKQDSGAIVNTVLKVFDPSGEDEKKTENGVCVCKDYDLIWENKVSCDFRKKILEISKRQNIDPNNLMAAMAHETGGKFDPTCGTFKKNRDESEEGYVGLLQIGKDAASDLGITRTDLLEMNHIKQLDYIEKYLQLPMIKGKLNTLTDFYLAVLFPVDCGKGNQPNHVVFDNSLPITYKSNGKPIKNLNYWRNVAYAANPAFHKEGENENGKTYVWEIADNIKNWYDNGKNNKEKIISCKGILEITKQNGESKSKIVYFDTNLTEDRINVVSQFTIDVLEKAAKNSSNNKLLITSTIRSTRKQAEVMYSNENSGNHIGYAAPGREVINVFNIGKRLGHSQERIITDMDTKIKELSGRGQRVSLHCVTKEVYNNNNNNNIIDVSYSREIKNPRDLIRELVKNSAVTKIIHPLNNVVANDKIKYDSKEPAIHIEIQVP